MHSGIRLKRRVRVRVRVRALIQGGFSSKDAKIPPESGKFIGKNPSYQNGGVSLEQ